jgi:mRNA interferase YafQ
MRVIEWSSAFGRDYKREGKTYGRILDDLLADILLALMDDELLQANHRDHNLAGKWEGCRECHVRPDLLLIYEKYSGADEDVLFLMRLGSHSELFGS